MRQKSKEVLIEYIKENQDKLYKIAYVYTKNQEMALDVVQEAITKALENIGKLRNEEFVKTWFYRILINESLKAIKKKVYECELAENTKYSSHEEKVVQNLDIYSSIEKLNEKIKTVIFLRYFENLKLEEIARITNTNISTVKSRLYKGIKEIRKEIERSRL